MSILTFIATADVSCEHYTYMYLLEKDIEGRPKTNGRHYNIATYATKSHIYYPKTV